MGTVPTGTMERELKKLYLRWVKGLADRDNITSSIDDFEKRSKALIERMGGHAASLGALAGFPAPKLLDLDPVVDYIYDEMKQAAVQAGIAAGLNAKEMARAMLNAGMDKSYRKLERFARTETVRAYWNNSWDSIEGLDLVMVWSSENGPRTCQYCDSRDGLVVDDRSIRDHPNGRCTLLPTLASRVAYKGTLQPDGGVYQDPAWAKETPPTTDVAWKPVMTQEEADLWSTGSAVPQNVMHGTSQEAAQSIRSSGFTLSQNKYGRLHGNGVYVTENQGTLDMYDHGASLNLKANVKNPVELTDVWVDSRFGDILDEVGDPAQAITQFADKYGYDSLIKRAKDGSIDELVVFDPRNLVVVK